MPAIDGLAFHEILGRERPGLARRTVFVTGDVLGAPTRVGAAAHQPTLSKPFTFDRLEEAVAGLLRTGVAERSA